MVHSSLTQLLLAVAVRPLGAPAGASGVAVLLSVSAPSPMLFTARSLKVYSGVVGETRHREGERVGPPGALLSISVQAPPSC